MSAERFDPADPQLICGLSIAGLGITLHCNDPALAAALRQRYRDFPLETEPLLVARIMLAGSERTAPLYDPALSFHDGLIRFTTPSYFGTIDAQAGRAELTISSTYPLEDIEYFVRVIYALLAFRAGGLLLHGAGIARTGRGYLFCGYSGSGKTTVARLSPDDQVLNDDLVVALPDGDRWLLYATPFWNPTQVRPGGIKCAPLTALLRLVQNTTVFLEPMGAGQALAEIIANAPVLPADPTLSAALLLRGQQILRAVPAYRLHFLPDPSFWPLVEVLA
ncbi:MAG: hypothetical protein JOZ51_26015 [Chloroflexi bacterium]|nr:hypothetical protein [Chloroflexota bacterium]